MAFRQALGKSYTAKADSEHESYLETRKSPTALSALQTAAASQLQPAKANHRLVEISAFLKETVSKRDSLQSRQKGVIQGWFKPQTVEAIRALPDSDDLRRLLRYLDVYQGRSELPARVYLLNIIGPLSETALAGHLEILGGLQNEIEIEKREISVFSKAFGSNTQHIKALDRKRHKKPPTEAWEPYSRSYGKAVDALIAMDKRGRVGADTSSALTTDGLWFLSASENGLGDIGRQAQLLHEATHVVTRTERYQEVYETGDDGINTPLMDDRAPFSYSHATGSPEVSVWHSFPMDGGQLTAILSLVKTDFEAFKEDMGGVYPTEIFAFVQGLVSKMMAKSSPDDTAELPTYAIQILHILRRAYQTGDKSEKYTVLEQFPFVRTLLGILKMFNDG